jgi:hypothetical protein
VHSGRILLLLVLAATVAVEVMGYRQYRSDMAAWSLVEQSLVDLHSALDREPVARLGAALAAARTAVNEFADSGHRFPRDYRTRLQAADQGLRYLAIAADGAQSMRNWEAVAAYSDVTRLLPRGCDGDHLAFSPALVSEAFSVAGAYFISEAISGATQRERTNWEHGFYPPLDLARETAACQRLQKATLRLAADRSKASDPAHISKWKYHIEISNPTGCLMTPYSDDQIIPIPHSQVYRFHLDANRKARLEQVFCNEKKPGEAITVSVNGQGYDPVWLLDESGVNYAAQLAPRPPLAISPDDRR